MARLIEFVQQRTSASEHPRLAQLQRLDRHLISRLVGRHSYAGAKWLYHRRKLRQEGTPIVVFGVAKSGTTAIAEALKRAGYAPVFHVHDLDPALLAAEEMEYGRHERPWRNWDAQCVLERPATRAAPWNVISTVREPIGQTVSAFFHRGPRNGYLSRDTTMTSFLEQFGDRWQSLQLGWFESHLATTLGIDVYEFPFDPAKGYAIIETPTVRLLLLRLEGFAVAPRALAEFLGAPTPVDVPHVNVAKDKDYAALYAAFLREARPPPEVVERAYASRLAQHFYSPEEIRDLQRAWSRSAEPSSADQR
jgi:hypothetical protein